jgi:hypothetical protein
VYEQRRKKERPTLVYCGDDARSKKAVVQLIRDAGFEPLDAGPLSIARYIEPFTLLIAELAYERPGGPALAYRFMRMGKALEGGECKSRTRTAAYYHVEKLPLYPAGASGAHLRPWQAGELTYLPVASAGMSPGSIGDP